MTTTTTKEAAFSCPSSYKKLTLSNSSISNANMNLVTDDGIATLTIKTPLYPVDGERFRIFSTQTITTLTMTASQSQTLNGAVTSMTANTGYEWIYSAGSTSSNGTWDRIL